MPISKYNQHDKLIWHPSNTGVFTVRSAYHLEVERSEILHGESSCRNTSKNVWESIWKLKIPNAAKLFVWKACKNILPTKDNLMRRKVIQEDCCFICNGSVETAKHILWECPSAQDVWGGSKIIFQKSLCVGENFVGVLEYLIGRCSVMDLELAGVIAWRIWKRRNSVLHGGEFLNPARLVSEAEDMLAQFRRVNQTVLGQGDEPVPDKQIRWTPPPVESYKANWDAAINLKEKKVGIGVIIRDYQGWVFAALSKTIQISLDPTMAEAAAALLAVEFSRDSGLQQVILEGDSKNVVLALSETEANLSRYGQIIEDAKVVLCGFRNWEVRHVYRQANMAAHGLAKEAAAHDSERVWLEEVPNCICQTVVLERLVLDV